MHVRGITKWFLLMLIFILPLAFCPSSYDCFELPKLLIMHIIVLMVLISMLAAKNIEFGLPSRTFSLPIFMLFAVSFLATIFSVEPYISFFGSYQHYGGLLQIIDMILLYILAFNVFSVQDIHKIFLSITMSGILLSTYGIFQHFGLEFGQWDISESSGMSALQYRSFSTLASPSFLGLYLAILSPLVMSGMIGAKSLKNYVLWGMALASILICLIFTYSRAAWLGFLAGFIFWIILLPLRNTKESKDKESITSFGPGSKRKWALIIAVLSLIIGIFLAPIGNHPSALDRAMSIIDKEAASVKVRFSLWHGSLGMIIKRPILGWGSDTFRFIFPQFAPVGMNEIQRRNVSAHNSFIDQATQVGLLGLAVYIWLLASIIILLIRLSTRGKDIRFIAALGAGIIGYVVTVQFGFSSIAPMSLWWIMLGCLARIDRDSLETLDATADQNSKLYIGKSRICLILIGLILFWGFATVQVTCWFIADIHFKRAELSWKANNIEDSILELRKAISLHPQNDFYLARLGQLQMEKGNDATFIFHKAVDANGINAANHALLATALQSKGQYASALDEWQMTIALDPQWAQAHNAIGIVYRKLENNDFAIKAFLVAIDIDPNYAIAYNNLGNAYLSNGKIEEAISAYQEALSLEPGWEIALRNMEIARNISKKSGN